MLFRQTRVKASGLWPQLSNLVSDLTMKGKKSNIVTKSDVSKMMILSEFAQYYAISNLTT